MSFYSLFEQILSPFAHQITNIFVLNCRIASGILGANEVVMTDLPYALPLMRENVERNKSSWKGKDLPCQRIECKECDWFQPPPINILFGNANEELHPDVILVADCVWLSPLIAPLLQTLKKYTANASTKVIITYQQRGREAHEEFLQGIRDLLDESMGLHPCC